MGLVQSRPQLADKLGRFAANFFDVLKFVGGVRIGSSIVNSLFVCS